MPGQVQVIQSHRPKVSDLLGTLGATLQGRQDTEQARADSQAKTKAQALVQFMVNRNATAEQWNAGLSHMAQTDPNAAALIPDIASLPPSEFQKAKEQLDLKNTQNSLSSANRVGTPDERPTDTSLAYNPERTVGTPTFREQQLSDVLKNNAGASPDQVREAKVSAKIAPTADVSLRESTEGPLRTAQTGEATANAAYKAGPQTQETLASAGEKRANIGKIRAETGAISAANQPSATTGAIGEDYLKSLPDPERKIVEAVGKYKVSLEKISSIRNPKNEASERKRLLGEVLQAFPEYDQATYEVRNKLRKDYEAGGKSFMNSKSLNQAMAHLDELATAARELGNYSGIPVANTAVNAAKNWLAEHKGGSKTSSAIERFGTAKTGVAGEMATVFKNTSGTDQEITKWDERMNQNKAPDQTAAGIQEMIRLIASRIGIMDDQWTGTMKSQRDVPILNSKSRAIAQKFGIDVDELEHGRVSQAGGGGTQQGGGAPSAAAPSDGGARMSKEQIQPATGQKRTVYSVDGGKTWHP